MPLSNIQLCHIDPVDRAAGKFEVTCNSDDGKMLAIFSCDSERAAISLRNAIRDHAARLRRAADYRDNPRSPIERDQRLEDVAMQLAQAQAEVRRLTRIEKAYNALCDAHTEVVDRLQRGARLANVAITQR